MMFFPSITFGNVIDKLNEVGKFNKLNETLTKSGLVETLKGNGPFTVFAPLDDAFAAISAKTYYGLLRDENKDKLVNILGRHVFSKKITSSEINGEIKLKAINGEEITIKKVNGIGYINDHELTSYYDDVYSFNDLLGLHDYTFNELQLRVLANAKSYVTISGGSAILQLLYQRPTVIYATCNREVLPEYWEEKAYYQVISNNNAIPVIDKNVDINNRGHQDYSELYEKVKQL